MKYRYELLESNGQVLARSAIFDSTDDFAQRNERLYIQEIRDGRPLRIDLVEERWAQCPKCLRQVQRIFAVDAEDFCVVNSGKPVVRGICRDCVRG